MKATLEKLAKDLGVEVLAHRTNDDATAIVGELTYEVAVMNDGRPYTLYVTEDGELQWDVNSHPSWYEAN